MKKYIKIIVIVFCLLSCNNRTSKLKTQINPLILGNWFSLKNNSYSEYYFDEKNMSYYDLSSNIHSYEYYFINNEKIKFIDDSFEYFDEIISIDSIEINFKKIKLYKLNEDNTLGAYLNKEIEYDSLQYYFSQRDMIAIPLDSILKMAGEPIDIDELFKNSKTLREDLLSNIEQFVEYSENNARKVGVKKKDTDIYWVQFFESESNDMVVIMQQPYYDSSDTDGYIEINENLVFFYYSDTTMVDTSKLSRDVPKRVPDENSKESGLGYSAPNWAYKIYESGLEKIFIGE